MKLQNATICRQNLSKIKDLYFKSFPPEERRPWNSIESLLQANATAYNLKVLTSDGTFVGFISYWTFDKFCYIEHFAIDPDFRDNGIGSNALQQFINDTKLPIILEVEPQQCGEWAQRRINFYKRNNFIAHPHFNYTQPPYSPELPPVRLMLMTANAPSNFDLYLASKCIHNNVYGIPT